MRIGHLEIPSMSIYNSKKSFTNKHSKKRGKVRSSNFILGIIISCHSKSKDEVSNDSD